MAEKPRFGGINSLINRMTGGHPAPAQPAPERAQPALRQPTRTAHAYDEDQAPDPDQDRVEIPAFLRRQAN